jgi:hypothetical protein
MIVGARFLGAFARSLAHSWCNAAWLDWRANREAEMKTIDEPILYRIAQLVAWFSLRHKRS